MVGILYNNNHQQIKFDLKGIMYIQPVVISEETPDRVIRTLTRNKVVLHKPKWAITWSLAIQVNN